MITETQVPNSNVEAPKREKHEGEGVGDEGRAFDSELISLKTFKVASAIDELIQTVKDRGPSTTEMLPPELQKACEIPVRRSSTAAVEAVDRVVKETKLNERVRWDDNINTKQQARSVGVGSTAHTKALKKTVTDIVSENISTLESIGPSHEQYSFTCALRRGILHSLGGKEGSDAKKASLRTSDYTYTQTQLFARLHKRKRKRRKKKKKKKKEKEKEMKEKKKREEKTEKEVKHGDGEDGDERKEQRKGREGMRKRQPNTDNGIQEQHIPVIRQFSFTDHAPKVFQSLRLLSGISKQSYIQSLCREDYVEFISNSKSGAIFYYSGDMQYMIKTIPKNEAQILQNMLKKYHSHLCENPNSLLSRIYGLYSIDFEGVIFGRKRFFFIVMQSLFNTSTYIHTIFDLKGSQIGRSASSKDFERKTTDQNTSIVLKDLDARECSLRIDVGPKRATQLVQQLQQDAKLLKQLDIIDYSLLIGIHYRDLPSPIESRFEPRVANPQTECLFGPIPSPDAGCCAPCCTTGDMNHPLDVKAKHPEPRNKHPEPRNKQATANVVDVSGSGSKDLESRGKTSMRTSQRDSNTGIKSLSGEETYFIGVIDFLVPFGLYRFGEYVFKGYFQGHGDKMSVIPPKRYADRFNAFCEKIIR
eukprot:CAMPEP_0184503756 /NCGR_PEP_ID=MMETSP0113_2-20130426/52077_1 /TAXON_ID=91329 /ORGANISM="Norrisiella sphaerica, Strain BC52" /LENGTH=644 /DNA_ID=CAMNT_0026893307 /DNA_START=184 /DNA_END=2118 /DNA_ORIENTATION=+